MPTPTPQILLPYLSNLSVGSLLLITSVLNASANWLVVRCILAALQGDQNAQPRERNDTTGTNNSRRVILLSFLRPLSLWVEIGKKAVRVHKILRRHTANYSNY
jgi:elongator complex protein 6